MALTSSSRFPSAPLTRLLGSNGPIHALTYSSSPGTYILTGSADRNIRLYNPFPAQIQDSGAIGPSKLIQAYAAHGYEVLDIAVSQDNARFTSVGGDRSVFLWDVTTAKTIQRFSGVKGHSARINSVCFGGSDDSVIISGSFDASVRIWDTKSSAQKPIQVFSEAKDSISCVLVNKNGGYEIVTGSVDGRVRYYDLRAGKMDIDVLSSPVTSLMSMRGGEAVLAGTLDGKIRLIDRSGGGCLMTYKGHTNTEFRIRSTFGGKEAWVLSGSEREGYDGQIWVWDTISGDMIQRLTVKGIDQQESKKRIVGSDGIEKPRTSVVSCIAWKNEGRGDQWCCAGTDGVVTVYGLG